MPQPRLDLILREYIEVSVVSSTSLLGENDGLSCHRGGAYKPARIGNRLKDRGGAFYIMEKEKRLLCFFLLVQVHDVDLLGVGKNLVSKGGGVGGAKLTQI
jgi:hypothetical protein